MPSQGPAGKSEVDFQHLPEVHPAGNAQRIQYDLQRRAVRQRSVNDLQLVEPAADGQLVMAVFPVPGIRQGWAGGL